MATDDQLQINRRDFVNGTLAGAGASLLAGMANAGGGAAAPTVAGPGADWYGYGGVGDYRSSHGNTPAVVAAAHALRDGQGGDRNGPYASAQEVDLLIVGAGMAGLGAALEYSKKRRPGQTCLLLDNHPLFGGEAKENEFNVAGTTLIAPQGANGFFVPPAVTEPDSASGDARYYAELGIPRSLPYGELAGSDRPLRFCKDNYGYLVRGLQDQVSVGHHFAGAGRAAGQWSVDMWQQQLRNTPLSPAGRESLLAWYRLGATRSYASDHAAMAELDQMSYQDFLLQVLKLDASTARYSDLFLASAAGLGSDMTSAYAAFQLPMPGLSAVPPASLERQSFPGGNSGYARYFLKTLLPDAIAGDNSFADVITGAIRWAALDRPAAPLRMRLDSTAVSVQHDAQPGSSSAVNVVYTRAGKLHAVRAKAVIMASGGWMNRHVVRDLPASVREAYAKFHHAPFLVANVALNNWRFMHKLGITAAIWERQEQGFGFTCNLRQPMHVGRHQPALDPDRPAVLSFYTPYFYPGLPIQQQTARGRAELFHTSYAAYEQKIVAQMNMLFAAAGFRPQRDIAAIILNRWGHAYSVPYPGFYGGGQPQLAPRNIIRRGYGRVAFAHSELDGLQHWGPAADEGRRAYTQLAAILN